MRSLGKAGITTWAVLLVGSLMEPGAALAQFGGFGGGLGSMLGGGGGNRGGGGMGMGGGLSGLGGLLGGGVSSNPWQSGMSSNPWQSGTMGPGYGRPNPYPNQGYPNQGYPNQGYPNTYPNQAAPATYPSQAPPSYVNTVPVNPAPAPRARPVESRPAPAPAPVTPPPATPDANIIPDFVGSTTVATNTVRTQLPAVSPSVLADLGQELTRSLEEGVERLEANLRDALFSNADETSLLAIYDRAYGENSPEFRLARKNIKYLDAGELRQNLINDTIRDAGAMLYPAKLEVSAVFDTFKRAVLGGNHSAEVERATKALLKTYEGVIRSPEFESLNVPNADQIRKSLASLRQALEVSQQLTESKSPATGGLIAMDKRFRIARIPGLPRDMVQAISPQVCLWGTGSGSGTIEIQDAELFELGVPLLNLGASPLAEASRTAPYTGTLVENPKANGANVKYVIDGVRCELKPGESRSHKIQAKSQITFNRNATLGNVTYSLSACTYRFSIQAQARAWQVQKVNYSVLVDNSANAFDFQCEVNGQPRVIPSKKTLQLSAAYPILIRFDKGNDQARACKVLGDNTPAVTVGVAPGTAVLDLFPGKSQALAARPLNLESIAAQATSTSGRQTILPTFEDLQLQ